MKNVNNNVLKITNHTAARTHTHVKRNSPTRTGQAGSSTYSVVLIAEAVYLNCNEFQRNFLYCTPIWVTISAWHTSLPTKVMSRLTAIAAPLTLESSLGTFGELQNQCSRLNCNNANGAKFRVYLLVTIFFRFAAFIWIELSTELERIPSQRLGGLIIL